MARLRIYLAGPTVFRADAAARGNALKALCTAQGAEGLYPLDITLPDHAGDAATARLIHDACLEMLRRADCVVADLSPFRGPHVDDGTAFELGYAAARGLPIHGYSSDLRPLSARIPAAGNAHPLRCRENYLIEDFGQPFNAMIAGALASLSPSAEEAIRRAAGR